MEGFSYRAKASLYLPCRKVVLLYQSERLLYRPGGLLHRSEDLHSQGTFYISTRGLLYRPEGLLHTPDIIGHLGPLYIGYWVSCACQQGASCIDQRASYIMQRVFFFINPGSPVLYSGPPK